MKNIAISTVLSLATLSSSAFATDAETYAQENLLTVADAQAELNAPIITAYNNDPEVNLMDVAYIEPVTATLAAPTIDATTYAQENLLTIAEAKSELAPTTIATADQSFSVETTLYAQENLLAAADAQDELFAAMVKRSSNMVASNN